MARVTAISSLGWAHYTLFEALPQMQSRSFNRIEIASFDTYCFHFNNGSPNPYELRKMLAERDLQPVCLNYSPGRFDAWRREDIERFEQAIVRKLAHVKEAGIPMMTMMLGDRNHRTDQLQQLANIVAAYERVAEIASEQGIRLLLEVPHLYSILCGVEPVLWVVNRLRSPNVGMLVDSSHWGIIGYDLDAFLDAIGERLWHVHLRDSRGPDTGDRRQQLELTPGQGTVDFRAFGQALDRVGYAGDVSIEFEYRDLALDAIEREFDVGLRHLIEAGWEMPSNVQAAS